MTNASLSFLLFAIAAVVTINLRRDTGWRLTMLVVSSIAFLLLSSPDALLPILIFLIIGFAGLKLIETGGKQALATMLVITILLYIWLKQYTFFPSALFLPITYTTLGLSYILFRILHLLIDASNRALPGPVALSRYLAYTLNFTTFVAGPIQRYQDFDISLRRAQRPSVLRSGEAIERIIIGFFKVDVLALALSLVQAHSLGRVTDSTNAQTQLLSAAVTVAAYPFFLYCNFSGYIDVVIGIARLMGMDLPENFDRPFSADSFIGFWSRWHITLSTWLKTYVYNPLAIALIRRFPAEHLAALWAVIAYFVTFFLIGVWHGRTSMFLFFGVLQGFGVSANKLYEIGLAKGFGRKRAKALGQNTFYSAVCRGLTFTWFAFTLIWFWSSWSQIGNMASAMGPLVALATFGFILISATVGLAAWEAARRLVLAFELGETLISSRYTRTAWCTVLALLAIVVGALMRQHTPEIIYKTF